MQKGQKALSGKQIIYNNFLKKVPILKKNERLVVFKNNYVIFECNQNSSI